MALSCVPLLLRFPAIRSLRRFSESSAIGTRLSSRFVAGMEIEDALRVAESVNRQGMAVSLDSLGESVTTEAEAHALQTSTIACWMPLHERKLNANVSVKLTQMGLELSRLN